MRTKVAALALAMAVTSVHADDSAKYLLAGMLSGIIVAASMDAKRQQEQAPAPAPVVVRSLSPSMPSGGERKTSQPAPVYVPPPPPPTARSRYLETCQAYGFSAGYCVAIWDGKTLQAAGS